MGFEIKDLGGISDPAKKLIEVVSSGIGMLFRPRAMRNETDAKAYEIRALAEAEADGNIMKAQGHALSELERIRILSAGNPELLERAKIRLLSREVEGQLNVETIAEHALTNLPASVSEQPVADDWRRKFFQEAENICDNDLQFLWGKVLSGEVTSPGSYSLRTLEVLKHISKTEAELFRQACGLAFSDGWIMIPGDDINTVLKPYGLSYNSLLMLRDAGLLHEGDNLVKDLTRSDIAIESLVFNNNGVFMQLSGPALRNQQIPSLAFTRAGQELQRLMDANPCVPYLQSVATRLRQTGVTVKKGTETQTETDQTVLTFTEDF